MRTTTTPRRTRFARILAAALIVVPTALATLLPTVSTAAPTEEQVDSAKARLNELNHQLETSIEAWNDARYQLTQVQARLAEAKKLKDAAEDEAAAARAQLSDRAVDAYTGFGSQLDVLLDAEDFNEFSDRLEFLGAIAESDADLAAKADAAGQRAQWAAEQYAEAEAEAQQKVDAMAGRREEIAGMLDEQEAIYQELSTEWEEYQEAQAILAAQREALEQAQQQETTPAPPPPQDPPPTGEPPPVSGAAGVAVQAAYSVVGTPYVFGSSNPAVGLDCSGVTSYAWAQAGVYLPHSAAAQRAYLPEVPLSQVQPGDIIYYGNFGPHVAIYVGGGQIIHATSPAPGGHTRVDSLYGYDRPWSAHRVSA